MDVSDAVDGSSNGITHLAIDSPNNPELQNYIE
jgi:hypothetical protein